ncbi:hypothetical protein WN944_024970 [Citrus x changshan-huyou]|uniref:Uncharacterized protein n=1 Tax=Citrus x changshan-huyou TaxID=2935761 RepID=A0AAP0LV80_9ROSI
MKKTAQESNREGRIENVSSISHWWPYGEGIRFDKINDHYSGYNSFFAYIQSKLANVLHANELARRLKEDGVEITANSLHPGIVLTNIFREGGFLNATDDGVEILGKGDPDAGAVGKADVRCRGS